MKALIERVRNVPCFVAAQLQQLQVDLYFATQLLFEMVYVDDESFVIAAFFEMMESAKLTAIDSPATNFLDAAVLEQLAVSTRTQAKI